MNRLLTLLALALCLSHSFSAHADSIQGVLTRYTYYAEGYIIFDPDIGQAYNIIYDVSENRKCLKDYGTKTVYDKASRSWISECTLLNIDAKRLSFFVPIFFTREQYYPRTFGSQPELVLSSSSNKLRADSFWTRDSDGGLNLIARVSCSDRGCSRETVMKAIRSASLTAQQKIPVILARPYSNQ